MTKKLLYILFALFFLVSCAHYPVTSPKSEGEFFRQEKVYKSIVKVSKRIKFKACKMKSGECKEVKGGFGSGSGFALSLSDDYTDKIVTARHVCETSEKRIALLRMRAMMSGVIIRDVQIKTHIVTDNDRKLNADIYKSSDNMDACIMRSSKQFPALHLASQSPHRSDRYYSAGAPLGIHGEELLIQNSGLYSGQKEVEGIGLIDFYSIPAAGGSSGSAILDKKGRVVGIITRGDRAFGETSLSPAYEQLHFFFTSHLK